MTTIQLSPQLHHTVKWAKVHETEDSPVVIQYVSLRISSAESKALLSTFKENKDKVTQEELISRWG